jgi:hypothetical protein
LTMDLHRCDGFEDRQRRIIRASVDPVEPKERTP